MFLSQIREQNLSDKVLLNNELIVFLTCSLRVVFNRFISRGFFFLETCLRRTSEGFFLSISSFVFQLRLSFYNFSTVPESIKVCIGDNLVEYIVARMRGKFSLP